MENITIGQINAFLVYVIGFGGVIFTIYKTIKSGLEKGLKPINDKIDRVDKNATMNYLVTRMDEIDNGHKLEGVSKKRFIDEYEHYTKELNGNTYIHDEYERLKKEGKL